MQLFASRSCISGRTWISELSCQLLRYMKIFYGWFTYQGDDDEILFLQFERSASKVHKGDG